MGEQAARTYRNARLRDRADLVDIAVREGRIVDISASAVDGAAGNLDGVAGSVDLGGALVLPTLIESHIHLEKAYLLDRMPREATSLQDAMALTSELKRTFTPADMRSRALRVLRAGLGRGVTVFRAHVELDDTLGLSAIETMLALRAEVRGVVDLQVVAFPQDGLTSQRTAIRAYADALDLGADVVGGIPYADDDPSAHLDLVFAQADRTGLPVDLHLDLSDDPTRVDVVEVAERTIALGLQGRVTVGHLTSLGSVELPRAQAIADLLARAGISVVTLPATDAYLNGRGDTHAPRRGLTPVRLLLEAGVNVAVATNNIQNAFTPFGRGSLLDTALLLATLCHFGSADDARTVVDMMTRNAARAVGLPDDGVVVGGTADFVAFPARHERELLGDVERPTIVVKRGEPVGAAGLPHPA